MYTDNTIPAVSFYMTAIISVVVILFREADLQPEGPLLSFLPVKMWAETQYLHHLGQV